MRERIFGLDLLRCTAILLVLLSHTLYILFQSELALSIAIYAAVIGVEAFFVLSGFLIGSLLIKMHYREDVTTFASVKLFLIRRWFRTLPNYYLILVISVILLYLSSRPAPISGLRLLCYPFFLQNLLTLETNAFFGVSWSLCIEEWFYLLFPFALLLAQHFVKDKKKSLLYTILAFLLIPLLLRIAVSTGSDIPWDAGFRKLTFLRLDAIAIGVFAAYIQYHFNGFWNKHKIRLAVTGSLALCLLMALFYYKFIANFIVSFNEIGDSGLFLKTFFFTLLSFAIAAFLPSLAIIPSNTKNYLSRFITSISLTSYAIYLLHPLVIMLVYSMMEHKIIPDNNLLTFWLIWAISIAGSYLLYHLFEKRMTTIRDRFS